MKKAFTLAEMMIVLVVIAVITAILLPAARHATPDENILKFKKAHNVLHNAIQELVNSDEYYLNGDLGVKPNGDLIDGTHDGDITYLCNTIADVIGAKKVNCSETIQSLEADSSAGVSDYPKDYQTSWVYSTEVGKNKFDEVCLKNAQKIGAEIELPNGVIFYQTGPNHVFGMTMQQQRAIINDNRVEQGMTPECVEEEGTMWENCKFRFFGNPNTLEVIGDNRGWYDKNNFLFMYKFFCIDIDGIDKGEDPFGYGIRADGKIIAGARADEWLEKSINKN